MKKIVIILMALLLVGCSSGSNEPVYSPEYPDYLEEVFGNEEWQTPGLVNADGTEFLMPEPHATTGERLNVLDFGAKAGDENFDNSESFNLAMEAAQPGDEVYVPAGTYYFSEAALFSNSYVAHIVLKSEVNLIGDGMEETILVSKFDADTNEKYKTTVIIARTQSNITISDLTITSDTDDSRLPDPDVSNFNTFVETAPVYGIVLDNDKPIETHENITIQNVLVEKFQRMGIRIRVMRNVRVSNCVIQKATDLGGGGAGYGISIQGMSNGTDLTDTKLDSVHNIVENCTINGPYIRHGILIQYYSHNNLITNNTISDTLLDAIDMHGEDEYGNEICYNTITNTRRGAAIGLGNSGATHDATGPYNYIHHNTITGGDRGIDIQYGTTNSVIVDNVIQDIENEDATGIFVQNGNNTLIKDNEFSNITGIESCGIEILYSYNALEPEKGIPDGIQVVDNSFTNLNKGLYIETYSDDYTYDGNKFKDIVEYDYLDDSAQFELPPVSDVVIPKIGDLWYPTDDNFITNESRDYPQSQANMKFKASYFDVPYNRMIYLKFDLQDAPLSKEKVYLKLTGKSKDGLATINIFGTTAYTDWSEREITWENSKYHEDQVAVISDPNGDLTHITDFTFTAVGSEYNTYYVDVTDYIKSIGETKVTFILANNAVENMYCEIYSKEVSSADFQLALVFSNGN